MSAEDFPWLSVLAAIPLLGAVLIMALPRGRLSADSIKTAALGISVLTLAVSVAMLTQFDSGAAGFQLTEQHEWIGVFGAYYAVGVDGIGVTLILLTTILTPVVLLASWRDGSAAAASGRRWNTSAYLGWMLALEGLAIGVFAATDVFLFYVLFEATLIPV